MKIIKTSIDEFDENIIHEAIDILANGGIVLYPTDTVYGLGANIFDNSAVKRVFEIKQRNFLKPLDKRCKSSYSNILHYNRVVVCSDSSRHVLLFRKKQNDREVNGVIAYHGEALQTRQ